MGVTAGAASRAAPSRIDVWRKQGQRRLGMLMVVASIVGAQGRVCPSMSGTGIGRLAVSRSRSQVLLLRKKVEERQLRGHGPVAGKAPATSAFLGAGGALRATDPRRTVQLSGLKFLHPARAGRITYGTFGMRPSARLSSTMNTQAGTATGAKPAEAPRLKQHPPPKRFFLLRHGQTDFNAEGRVQGSSDVSVLSEVGVVQAQGAGKFLGKYDFSKVFVSPLARAVQTLEQVRGVEREGALPDAVLMDDLREIDLYEWQGMLKADIRRKYPQEYKKWRGNGASKFVLPSGNAPVVQLWERARGVWDQVMAGAQDSEGPCLVVAHSGIIQAMLCTAMGLDEDWFRTFQVPNCGVLELEWVPGETVARRWRWLYPEESSEWRIVSSGSFA